MDTSFVVAGIALAIAILAAASSWACLRRLEEVRRQAKFAQQTHEEFQRRVEGLELFGPSGSLPPATLAEEEARKVSTLESTVQVLELRAKEHDTLLCALVTEDEARHLWHVSRGCRTVYDLHSGVESELRGLVRRGLLRKTHAFEIHRLDATFDLCRYFALTETGESLLALRGHLRPEDEQHNYSRPPESPEEQVSLEVALAEVRAII